MKWQTGNGLYAIRGVSQRLPRSASCPAMSISPSSAARKAWYRPNLPSSTELGPAAPWAASRVARCAPWAAHAGCIGFVGVPSARYAKRPPANDPAMPSALVVTSASRSASRPTAATAPKIPQIAVGWKPRAWNAPGAAIPTRQVTSFPATIAASASRPPAPTASAAARAAGAITVETWLTESECVSSKSSPWQSIAFANAAFAAGSRASEPITVAWGDPPSSSIVERPSCATPVACAASPQPMVSSTCSFASARTGSGTSSSSSVVAHSAIVRAAVIRPSTPRRCAGTRR